MIERTCELVAKIEEELGVKQTRMQGRIKKYKQSPSALFPGSGNFSPGDE